MKKKKKSEVTDEMYKALKEKEAGEAKRLAKKKLRARRATLRHNPLKDEQGPLDKGNKH